MNADATNDVLTEVLLERERQHDKWGEQNLPDGTDSGACCAKLRDDYRLANDHRAALGTITWGNVFTEEGMEALCETDPDRLREELIQVAAVCVAWVEAIDRRV